MTRCMWGESSHKHHRSLEGNLRARIQQIKLDPLVAT